MDRQSKKEVKKYVLCFFVLVAAFILSVLALAYHDEQVKSKQLALLVAEHPELEGTVIRILEKEDADTKALITNISHQLKTPLAAIRMSHELAAGNCVSDEERQEFMEQEEIQIAKLQDLLDELVKLSRLEKNMIVLQPIATGFKQTITDAVSQIYPKAHAKKMEIVVEITEDAVITHDVKWTTEALINVLDNAVKYSDAGKHIFIRMSRLTRYVLIEIEDEGMGIPGAELHKIYHRFYRGSNVEKDSEGAGVGLYLTRWIIEAQGGTIAAKNKLEAGMVFRIMLPLNSDFS